MSALTSHEPRPELWCPQRGYLRRVKHRRCSDEARHLVSLSPFVPALSPKSEPQTLSTEETRPLL